MHKKELSCSTDILARYIDKGEKVTVPDEVLGVNLNDLLFRSQYYFRKCK